MQVIKLGHPISQVNNSLLEVIDETKLLGTVDSSDFKWHSNTEYLSGRGFQRITKLRKLAEFNVPQEDMTLIYCQYIRSVLEYNSSVWFSSITEDEKDDNGVQSESSSRIHTHPMRMVLKY